MVQKLTDALVPVADMPCGPYWLDHVKAKIVEDWKGEPCVTERDAAKAMKAYETDLAAHEDRQDRHRAYLAQREIELREVGERAFREALNEGHQQQLETSRKIASGELQTDYAVGGYVTDPRPSPQVRSHALEVRRQAVAAWEQKNPEIGLEDFK